MSEVPVTGAPGSAPPPSGAPALGIRLHGGQTVASAVAMARAADEAGLASVWFAENPFARGCLPLAAACAGATSRIGIGAGVFSPFTRHPAVMAMDIGALDEVSGGRASITVGSGIAGAIRRLGRDADKPLGMLRETLTILRGLIAGARVEHAGKHLTASGMALDFTPRGGLPIFLAGRGPLTVALAGALADGLVVSNMCSAGYARAAAERAQAARDAAGRAGRARVIQYMPCAVGDGAAARARRAVGAMVPSYWALSQSVASAKVGLFTGTRISEPEFAAAADRIRAGEEAADVLDERFTAAFSISGDPAECMAQAAAFGVAGVTDLALTFSGPAALEEIAALGAVSSGSPG